MQVIVTISHEDGTPVVLTIIIIQTLLSLRTNSRLRFQNYNYYYTVNIIIIV